MNATSYAAGRVTVHHGDCLDVLRTLPDASVDSVVTDPPYGIAFMGKAWDQPGKFGSTSRAGGGLNHRRGEKDAALEAGKYDLSPSAMRNFQLWCEAWATECLRILKPGGHLIAFGGARTWHRLAGGIEDAGFEIRDSLAWLFGSGFPKSLDVSKAVDKAVGATGVWRQEEHPGRTGARTAAAGSFGQTGHANEANPEGLRHVYDASSPEAQNWKGWGTALKPAFEPIVLARKPLVGTVATNVLAHGTGALNVDACRVSMSDRDRAEARVPMRGASPAKAGEPADRSADYFEPATDGRWPANVVLDEDQAAELDVQSGVLSSGTMRAGTERQPRAGGTIYGADARNFVPADTYGDTGGASRFFYVAKADQSERPRVDGVAHPTVKPLALMRWCARLITPPGGTVLDLFGGSGTTAEACLLEGFPVIVIEREAEYLPLIAQRVHRRTDPVAAVRGSGGDGGLFDLLADGAVP